ncbi:synaptic vesicle 2-related protein, partial [Nephila pilipes]
WYPESARYYLVSNQHDLATRTLEKMAKTNGKELPPGRLAQVGVDIKRGRLSDLLNKSYRRTSLLFWYIW